MSPFRDRLVDELARAHYRSGRRGPGRAARAAVVALAVAVLGTVIVAVADRPPAGDETGSGPRPAVRVRVAPSAATIHSEIGVRITAPPPGREARYVVSAEAVAPRPACVVDRDAIALDRGDGYAARLDPRAGEGGNLGWCPGEYRGTVERVHAAAGRSIVGRFRFTVGAPPGTNEVVGEGCAVGAPPGSFYPHAAGTPVVLLGCARLATSGKPVDFVGSRSRIGGDLSACLGATYTGGGQRGALDATLCRIPPPVAGFAVRDRRVPRGGADGYGYVIWGTLGDQRSVTARWSGGRSRAAIIDVPAARARRFGAPALRLFVIELPRAARCEGVVIAGRSRAQTVADRGCRS